MNIESFHLFIHCFVTCRVCSTASLNNSPPGQLNSYYIHLEFSFTGEVIYATAVQATYPDQTVSQKINRYDPKMPPTTIFFFQVIFHTSKIVLFYSSSLVYKNFVFPKLPCHSLCLISSKETALAWLNLWMIHPNRTDETQRQAVKWTVFYEPVYDVYISYDISSKAFPMCLQDPSVSLRAFILIY